MTFDASDFLTSSNESVLDDKFNLIDVGEYTAQIGVDDKAIVITKGESINKAGETKPWAQMAIRYEIIDPTGEVEKKLQRKPQITHRIFLDLNEQGKLDLAPQRNVRLGQLLKATGKAAPGWKLTDLKGQQLKIKVIQVKSDLNPDQMRNDIGMVGQA
jgi:hypothetical protein